MPQSAPITWHAAWHTVSPKRTEADRHYVAVASCGPRTALGTATGRDDAKSRFPRAGKTEGRRRWRAGQTQREPASSCSERPLLAAGLRAAGSGWPCTCRRRAPGRRRESEELRD